MDKALRNAVARIALAPVRLSLPRWASVSEGEVYHTRQNDLDSKLPQRGFRSQPVLALSLNWANSGPGFSWPLDYYVAWLPFYEEYVVTVSYDDPVVEGYLDLAIGTLPEKAKVEVHLKRSFRVTGGKIRIACMGGRNAGTRELWKILGLGEVKFPGGFRMCLGLGAWKLVSGVSFRRRRRFPGMRGDWSPHGSVQGLTSFSLAA